MASNKQGKEKVEQFMNTLEHPLKDSVEVVRRLILNVNENITEQIKWNAPSFCINDEDRITFNLPAGLLEWAAADRAIIKLTNVNDVESKKEDLIEIVAKWIEVTG